MTIDIEKLLPWSPAVRLNTKLGPRMLRKAKPNEDFSRAWNNGGKDQLKAAGVNWSKDDRTGEWTVCWWQPIPKEVAQAEAASIEASRATDADIDIPAPPGCEYLPFQKAGIKFALGRANTLIGDEMGLGKTLEAIGVINAEPKIARVLVICPAGLKINWYREMKKWLTRPLTVGIASSKVFPTTDIVIINFDIAYKYAETRLAFYWDLIVIDEAHRLKSSEARRTKAIFGYKPTKKKQEAGEKPRSGIPARRKLLLTGTPICNHPAELFPLLNYLDPVRWPNFFAFAKRYAGAHNNGWGWDFSGATNLPELQNILRSTCMIRRLKRDVLLELPPKRRSVIEIPAESAEAKAAIAEEQEAAAAFAEDLTEWKARVELAKVSDDPAEYAAAVSQLNDRVKSKRDKSECLFKARHRVAVAKIPYVIEHIKDALEEDPEAKIVCFAHHLDVIGAIAEAFPGCAVMTGANTADEKQRAVDRFQTDPKCTLIVGGLFVMGVGWTLTASAHVVMAELDWVPGNVTQAEDRTHRIGQSESVLIQHLVLDGSVDVDVAKAIVEKQSVIDRALDVVHPVACGRDLLVSGASDGSQVRATGVYDDPREPIVPVKGGAVSVRRVDLDVQASKLTPENIVAIHAGLRALAGSDQDKARDLNGIGFSKVDCMIGHSLADQLFLTPRQAVLGQKMCRKYARQLGDGLLEAAGIKIQKDE